MATVIRYATVDDNGTTATVTSSSMNTALNWGTEPDSVDSGSILGQGQFAYDPVKNKISPQLYFTFVKKRFKTLERGRLEKRLELLNKAVQNAAAAGQEVLSKKMMQQLVIETRQSPMLAKGIKYYISKEDLHKHKNSIRGGHISDTVFKEYTRVVPEKVVKKKLDLEGIFDNFIIYHYWNPNAKDVKDMKREEKAKMKDPVLFGTIKEIPDRLYFIADWEDEYCDLTFKELAGVVAKMEIPKAPVIGEIQE